MRTNHLLCAAALLAALVPAARGQDLLPKTTRQEGAVLIQGATLHTVSGDTLRDASLLFEDGVITSIAAAGEALRGPPGVEVIEGAGKHVYPGFVAVGTILGLTEVGSVDMTNDNNEAGSVTPEVRAAVAINPDSTLIPVTRRNGVLTAGVMPQGGVVSGRASVIRLDGWTNADLEIVPDAGLVVNWPSVDWLTGATPGSSKDEDAENGSKALERLEHVFDAAAAYLAAREADPTVGLDLRYEAMAPTLRGETPLFVRAGSLAQITSAVSWTRERGLRPVIVGGRDAVQCADLLVRHDVPVAIDRAIRLPHRRDLSYASTFELPGRLEAAGVRWCLTMSTRTASNARNVPYEAAACIPYGLDPDVALRSVTLAAAEILGVGDRLGSLEAGKAATLFIADGDPFELSTRIEAAFIDGRRIDLRDKQTELDRKYREKYRQLGLLPGE